MEWKEVRLGDVCSIQRGASPRPIQKFISKEGMPWVKIADATGISSRYISSTSEYIIKEGISKSRIVHPGDLIVSNSATPGLPKFMAIEACVHDGWLIIRDLDGIDKVFLYYVFINIRRRLSNQANGSVFMNLKTDIVKDFVIKLPTLDDQRRIASILSSLDRKIELNNKINADLEEMAQAIFKNWFVDFEPFKDGKFVDSELGMIPEGWKVGTLADIAEITMGQSPAGNSLNENREGMIFYQGSSDFGFRFPSIRVFTTEPKRLAVANSVLFSVRAPVGDINVAKEECCIGRGVASIKSKYGHDSYLFYTMKSLHKLFDSFDGEGTVFGSINKKTLSAIQILLPSDGIVEQFNNIASSFDDRIRSLSDENSRLSSLRDTLLPRLMSGELEVPE